MIRLENYLFLRQNLLLSINGYWINLFFILPKCFGYSDFKRILYQEIFGFQMSTFNSDNLFLGRDTLEQHCSIEI